MSLVQNLTRSRPGQRRPGDKPAVPPALHTALRGPILQLYAVVLFGFVGFLVWASFAPLAGGAVMSGRLAVEGNRKTIQHLEGGIIAEIRVKEGAKVSAGEVLVQLHDVEVRSQLQVLRDRRLATQAQQSRLVAERDGNAALVFPEAVRAAAVGVSAIAEQVAAQERSFVSRRQTRDGQVAILRQRIGQLDRQGEGLSAQLNATEQQIATVRQELTGVRALYAQGLAARTRLLALEREAAQLQGQRGQLVADVAKGEVAKGEAELQIAQVETSFRSDVLQQLEQVERDLAELDERIASAQDQLERSTIRAPIAGRVTGLAVHTIGGVIGPGMPMMDIVPEGEPLILEAYVSPQDVDKVTVGAEAEVRFPTFSHRTTPSLFGTVQVVSADVLTDKEAKTSYYTARITVPQSEIDRLGGLRLLPGMPAEVILRTTERTALDYLLRPAGELLAHAFKED